MPGQVQVQSVQKARFTQQITAATHQFLADEPVSAGGDGRGPTPYDFLLAALGT